MLFKGKFSITIVVSYLISIIVPKLNMHLFENCQMVLKLKYAIVKNCQLVPKLKVKFELRYPMTIFPVLGLISVPNFGTLVSRLLKGPPGLEL